MANRLCRPDNGLSLWELLWTLAVAATVAAIGAPEFGRFLLDSRRTADINAFVLAVQLARSEAAKRGRPVILCKTAGREHCAGNDATFGAGWMVFVNADEDHPAVVSAADELLYFHEPRSEGPVHANRRLFEFRPFGFRSTNGTVTFCDRRGDDDARAVIISYTGRPRVAATGPGDRRLTCGAPTR